MDDLDIKDGNHILDTVNSKKEGGGSYYRDGHSERRAILKNVVLVSGSFMFLFTAYNSMASLQSSINSVDGLGTWSLSCLYAALVVSCMFLPAPIIARFTVKWAMAGSMLTYSAYIAAQFYPEFYTLIPAAIILGLGAAPMWSAQCTYLTRVAQRFAELTNADVNLVVTRFFGIFFLFFQFSSVFGNLISSNVLNDDEDSDISDEDLAKCGVDFCPGDNDGGDDGNSNFDTEKGQIYTLASIYLVFSVASAIVVGLFVDPLSRFGGEEDTSDEERKDQPWFHLAVATFTHLLSSNLQMLLIPITIWSGIEQGFFSADFTAAFVTCAYGVEHVGYVLVAYGACDAIFSIITGYVVKIVGRPTVFYFGAAVNVGVITVFFIWDPNPDEAYLFYILAGLWGVADAVWQTQINALYGVLFAEKEEAAFSNYRLWESIGFIIAYALQDTVCVRAKLWVVVASLATGMVGYTVVEFLDYKKQRKEEEVVSIKE